jgi:hypothetical protein
MKALERMPKLEGQRLLRRYGFHQVLERKLMQDNDHAKAALVMYEDQRCAAAVDMLLSLPRPTSPELLLASHLSAHHAFSSSGNSDSGDARDAAGTCLEYLIKAASALDSIQQQQQQQSAAAAAGGGRGRAGPFCCWAV